MIILDQMAVKKVDGTFFKYVLDAEQLAYEMKSADKELPFYFLKKEHVGTHFAEFFVFAFDPLAAQDNLPVFPANQDWVKVVPELSECKLLLAAIAIGQSDPKFCLEMQLRLLLSIDLTTKVTVIHNLVELIDVVNDVYRPSLKVGQYLLHWNKVKQHISAISQLATKIAVARPEPQRPGGRRTSTQIAMSTLIYLLSKCLVIEDQFSAKTVLGTDALGLADYLRNQISAELHAEGVFAEDGTDFNSIGCLIWHSEGAQVRAERPDQWLMNCDRCIYDKELEALGMEYVKSFNTIYDHDVVIPSDPSADPSPRPLTDQIFQSILQLPDDDYRGYGFTVIIKDSNVGEAINVGLSRKKFAAKLMALLRKNLVNPMTAIFPAHCVDLTELIQASDVDFSQGWTDVEKCMPLTFAYHVDGESRFNSFQFDVKPIQKE